MSKLTDSDPESLSTEQFDERFGNIDKLSTLGLVELMNQADSDVPLAVARQLPQIAAAIEDISARFQAGGNIYYVGAGTSGRLATLDASEVYPTFGIQGRVSAIMAGGKDALVDAIEGAEDDFEAGRAAVVDHGVGAKDVVVGLASSGSTPFVMAALESAKELGALTVSISCNPNSKMSELAHHPIEVVVGPEIIAGSTRLKAGTAQKMVLNMISTITMVRAGKTYGNLMVDVVASNTKLRKRAIVMLQAITDVDAAAAQSALEVHDWSVKSAVLGIKLGLAPAAAAKLLEQSGGFLSVALGESR